MNEQAPVEKKQGRRSRTGSDRTRYTYEEKLRAVKLLAEEGFKMALVSEETGVCVSTLYVWQREYRKNGEQGLRGQTAPRPGRRLPGPVVAKILELKRANRLFGVQRIADALRRWFFLQASPETVRKTLHAADLMEEREVVPESWTEGIIKSKRSPLCQERDEPLAPSLRRKSDWKP